MSPPTHAADSRQSLAVVAAACAGATTQQAGVAASQWASTQSGSAQRRGARYRSDRARGVVASVSSDHTAGPGGRQVVPFHGFSDEYVRERMKLGKLVIRRNEIIINILKSGNVTERQAKAICPWCKPI